MKMSLNSPHLNQRTTPRPVFLVSHAKQEAVCKEVYDYLICKKLHQLKEAILHFNQAIKRMLK